MPIIKNFLVFIVITSCKIPQIFFLPTKISLGHLIDICLFLQNFFNTLAIITGLIIANSLNGG